MLSAAISTGLIDPAILRQPAWTLVLFALQYLFGILIIIAIPRLVSRISWRQLLASLGLERLPRLRDLAWALASAVLYLAVSGLTLILIQIFVPSINLSQKQNIGFNDVSDLIGLTAAFVSLIILAPIAEEAIFRGYLFGNLRRQIGAAAAVILTSALFGLVHGQWNVGIDVAILSVFLCILRLKTGSIWAGIFLHMTKNSLAYFFLFIAPLMGIQIQ